MTESPAQRALTAATVSLAIAVACVAMFLPPLLSHTTASVLRTVVIALVLASALLLHLVFLGIAASRMGRSVPRWVALSMLLFPIGSAMSLILLSWFGDEPGTPAPQAHG
jgi:nucleoside recognition membrane protein YjiH